jgi:pheromone shutdown-related protein TraB
VNASAKPEPQPSTSDAADETPAPGGGPAPARPVTVLSLPGPDGRDRTIHVIGTAHISRKSVAEVRELIERVKPDTVCVELCATRYEALTDDTRWRKLDIFQVIRQKKMLFLLASLALQAYQRRLGEKLGVRPGAELLEGVRAAEDVGAKVVLADRDVQATLRRTWANVGFFNKVKLLGGVLASVFEDHEIDEAEVEKLKDRDHISELMAELARLMPEIKTPLIDERDLYLMRSIEEAPGRAVVAVVGAGHVAGIVERFGETVDRATLERIPPPSLAARALNWVIPVLILGLFYLGWREHRGENLANMLTAWAVPTALGAGIATLVARGKLLSVASAMVAAPITSLIPVITAGMVSGLVEAWLRKPTVEDCERLGKDVTTLRGIYNNAFSRVLLVAVASSIGAGLGAYVGAAWLFWVI